MRRAEHALALLTYDRWGIIASKESVWKQEEGGGQRLRGRKGGSLWGVAVLLCTGDIKKNTNKKWKAFKALKNIYGNRCERGNFPFEFIWANCYMATCRHHASLSSVTTSSAQNLYEIDVSGTLSFLHYWIASSKPVMKNRDKYMLSVYCSCNTRGHKHQ